MSTSPGLIFAENTAIFASGTGDLDTIDLGSANDIFEGTPWYFNVHVTESLQGTGGRCGLSFQESDNPTSGFSTIFPINPILTLYTTTGSAGFVISTGLPDVFSKRYLKLRRQSSALTAGKITAYFSSEQAGSKDAALKKGQLV